MIKIQIEENILPVEIGNHHFDIDADDIGIQHGISDFIDKYRGQRIVCDEFIKDCKYTVDKILGKGAYDKIFTKDDLKPYYVILQLAEAISEQFENKATTEKMKQREQQAERELRNVKELMNGFSEFNKQLNYTEGKYGMKNVANKRQSAKKRKNRN